MSSEMTHYEVLSGEISEKPEGNNDLAGVTHLWCKELPALGIDFTFSIAITRWYRRFPGGLRILSIWEIRLSEEWDEIKPLGDLENFSGFATKFN